MLAAQFPALQALAYPTGADKMPNGVVSDPKIFVSIAPDGIVTIVAARAEMGTGAARTTLPMIVAEELDADWAKVRIVQSPGDEKKYGNQDTDGSRSVRHFLQPMRLCGATARTDAGAGGGEALGCQRRRSAPPRTTRSRTSRPGANSAMARSRPRRPRCRPRRPIRSS